jgi:maltose alpha-D-glucosyltransferase/alpha-amylase
MIALRQRHTVFGRGEITFIEPENRKILAFIRSDGAETVLCAYNLSRSSQAVALDLSGYAGMTPVDMQYRVPFPRITAEPYQLTFNEYGFYWLLLAK